MANVKITDLTAYTDPLNTDVLAIVDVTNDVTKKVSIANMAKNVSLGTAALPGVAFDGDPNTGIYSPGADQLAVATNGQGRLFIDASGNVGVGTASPNASSKLHVANGDVLISKTSGYASLFFNFIGVGTARAASIKKNYDSPFDLRIQGGNNSAAAPICFDRADGFENARFDDSGRLGIGDSAPESLLHLKGSNATLKIESSVNTGYSSVEFDRAADDTHFAIYAYDSSHASQANNVQFYGYQNGNIQFITNSNATPRLTITSAGLVGIGTTSPGSIFHVKPATDENIRFSGGSGDTRIACFNDAASSTVQLSIQASPLLFRGTGGTEVGRWDSSGRLLVGTSSTRSGWSNTTIGSNFLQIERAVTGGDAGISLCSNSVDAAGSGTVFLGKTRGASLGLSTIVVSGDQVGQISFQGADGTQLVEAARIAAAVDGTPGASDMPGRLVFSTTADGAASPTERLRITSAGLVGIGTTSPGSELHVAASSGYAELRLAGASGSGGSVEFYNSATQLGDIFIDTSNNMIFRNASEAFRVDSSRRLLVGTSTARAVGVTGPSEAPLQIETPDGLICGLTLLQNRIDAIGPNLRFGKTGGATVGSVTTVSDGHELGTIQFCGADGTDLTSVGALIRAQVDGTPGNDDMPGRLVFSTTADGAASPTERLRIQSDGILIKYGDTTSARIQPQTDNAGFLGEATKRWEAVYAVNGTIQTSDVREKTDIVDSPLGAEFIRSLRPVAYRWKVGGYTSTYDDKGNETITPNPGVRAHYGFIAQEVKQAIGETDFGGWLQEDLSDPDSQQSLRLHEFISPIVKALQEALDEIDNLKAEVAALKAQ
jgi:hypothetical protein